MKGHLLQGNPVKIVVSEWAVFNGTSAHIRLFSALKSTRSAKDKLEMQGQERLAHLETGWDSDPREAGVASEYNGPMRPHGRRLNQEQRQGHSLW